MRVCTPKYFLAVLLGLCLLLTVIYSLLVFPNEEEEEMEERSKVKFECPTFFLSNFSDQVLKSDTNEMTQHTNERRRILKLNNVTEVIYYTAYSDINIQMYKLEKDWRNPKDVVQFISEIYKSYARDAKLIDASITRIDKPLSTDQCQYNLGKSCLENYHFELFSKSRKEDSVFILRAHWRASDPSFYYYGFSFYPQTNQILANEISTDCENFMKNVTKQEEAVDQIINWN